MKKRLSVSLAAVFTSLFLASSAKGEPTPMVATWYQCCNPKTASGYPFSPNDPTIVAHRTLPFGTRLLLAYNDRQLCGVVRDRGPFVGGKHLDLTRAGAIHLGFKERGIATLQVTENGC